MKIQVELQEGDYGTPIEFANAVINWYLLRIRDNDYVAENEVIAARESLAEVSEHIQTYLRHN